MKRKIISICVCALIALCCVLAGCAGNTGDADNVSEKGAGTSEKKTADQKTEKKTEKDVKGEDDGRSTDRKEESSKGILESPKDIGLHEVSADSDLVTRFISNSMSGADNADGEGNGAAGAGNDASGAGIYADEYYSFKYNGKEFLVRYVYDNWAIVDSFKIVNEDDMKMICQALIDVHPIHGRDMQSYRTPEDMVYEWQQHNMAYVLLPDDSQWKDDAGEVCFDPEDQGKTFQEIYEARTGKKFKLW